MITRSHRPGHFPVQGQIVGLVASPTAAPAVSNALAPAHLIGPKRTLTQDLGFAIDQLVAVAIRAISPAVNDTFNALNCIDWLGDCLCRAARVPLPDGLYRDRARVLRLVDPVITLERIVNGATDKIRQLENFAKVAALASAVQQLDVVARYAAMIVELSMISIPEAHDRADVQSAYDNLLDEADRARTRLSDGQSDTRVPAV